MADTQKNQQDFSEDDLAIDTGDAAAPAGANAPPAVPESPLIKLLNAFGLGKKNPDAGPANDGPPAPAPAPVAAAAPAVKPQAPGTPPPMPPGPLVTIMTRNEFYRDGFRTLLRIAAIQGVVLAAMLATFVFYIGTSESRDRYFATTADGRIMQLTPLDQPNMTEAALMSWVAQAASEVMTFGYHDYQRRLQDSSRHFTQGGWETFTAALQKSKILEAMLAAKQVSMAAPRSAPVLIQQGVFNGKYRWILRLPLQVSYRSGDSWGREDSLNVTLVVERVPSLENPNGVGIDQWIATQEQ